MSNRKFQGCGPCVDESSDDDYDEEDTRELSLVFIKEMEYQRQLKLQQQNKNNLVVNSTFPAAGIQDKPPNNSNSQTIRWILVKRLCQFLILKCQYSQGMTSLI